MAPQAPPSFTAKRAPTDGAYYTSSALYNAGFRGWPLVVMTAIAGRESGWNPTKWNQDKSTQDNSVGLFQINYFGSLGPSRAQSYGSPSYLVSDPQAQADAAYQLAGGNSLSGLGNWALAWDGQPGSTPAPTANTAVNGSSVNYAITPYLAQAAAAAGEVGEFGPASASTIGSTGAWPGTAGKAVPSGNGYATLSAMYNPSPNNGTAGSSSGSPSGCSTWGGNHNGVVFQFKLPLFGGPSITWCQVKALKGFVFAMTGVSFIAVSLVVLGVGSIVKGMGGSGAKPASAAGTKSSIGETANVATDALA